MSHGKRWLIEPWRDEARELAQRLKISPVIGQILLNRGISQYDDAVQFLRPNLKNLHEPSLIPGLNKAAGRIAEAIRGKQKIVIYGDYDVDGITAITILWHAITILGGQVDSYIPHRIGEGYGLNSEAVGQIIDAGAQLIISVDCGITAIEPARVAKQRGVDLIITDHHEWNSGDHEQAQATADLPDCFAVVHPRLNSGGAVDAPIYPNPHLCGAGVAFKLAWGIGQAMNGAARVSSAFREFLLDATALAALGTIADVVPLTGENRVLAHFGLHGLKNTKLSGLLALIESAALTGQKIDSYDVGFRLAPRLNACGRMGHAGLAVEMLTTATPDKAREIAVFLDGQNRARQAMEKQILEQALLQVKENGWDSDDNRGLVLAGEGWHAGVIGIVASRIVDKLCRPTVMISLTNGQGQGSARSIPGFHLAHALSACDQYLVGHGGHEMAAGLKISTDRVAAFRAAFAEVACESISVEMLVPQLLIDVEAQISHLTAALVEDFARLGPFGQANRKPVICLPGVTVAGSPRRVGKSADHLQFTVHQGEQRLKCIFFGGANLTGEMGDGDVIDVAGEPTLNTFNGWTSVEMMVKDVRAGTVESGKNSRGR